MNNSIYTTNNESRKNRSFRLRKNQRVRFGGNIVPKFTSSIKLNSTDELWIPEYEGVYLFHDLRGVYYIGESNNLRRRFAEHKVKKMNTKLLNLISNPVHFPFFSWVRTYSNCERQVLEKRLVIFFKPFCNSIFYKKRGIDYVTY